MFAGVAYDRCRKRTCHPVRRQQRAFELASTLALEQSLQGALRLANHHHATVLAERVAAFIESRLEMEQAAYQQASPSEAPHDMFDCLLGQKCSAGCRR